MAIETSNISIRKGDTVVVRIFATDINGDYLNLNGYSARGYAKRNFSSTGNALNLNPVVHTSYTSGIVDLTISATDTSAMPVSQYVYDVEVYNFESTYKVANGYLDLLPEVST